MGVSFHDLTHSSRYLWLIFQDFIWMPFVSLEMQSLYKSWMMGSVSDRPNLIVTGSATVTTILIIINKYFYL